MARAAQTTFGDLVARTYCLRIGTTRRLIKNGAATHNGQVITDYLKLVDVQDRTVVGLGADSRRWRTTEGVIRESEILEGASQKRPAKTAAVLVG